MTQTIGLVPKRFVNANLYAWSKKQKSESATVDFLLDYIDKVDEFYDKGVGLALVGPPGVGKTYLACAVLNGIVEHCAEGDGGYSQRFYPLYTYLRLQMRQMELRDQWGKAGDQAAYPQWQTVSKELRAVRNAYDFVVFDDIGMEHRTATKWVEDEFQISMRMRYDAALPTIITSNHAIDKWGATYGEAMASFMYEACLIVPVQGVDLRK